ncbi:CotH kinase family protein [Candidatus Amoebophilus asiaticus]|nr:CotH kinase family protein [Candidatus Amoebophilus asiaticus]
MSIFISEIPYFSHKLNITLTFRNYLFILLLFVANYPVSGQIFINEVCSANGNVLADFENDYEDWIELYNPGSTAVNLQGYYFETFEDRQRRWIFPNIEIKADDCLLVFCSKKDRKAVIDHYELPITPWLTWRYAVGTSEPDTNWVYPSFNDVSWLEGIGPIGYGDGDDNTVITPIPVTSLYMRDTFTLNQTDNILIGFLLMDYDDAFVAYINGVEVGRSNIWTPGRPPFDALASEEHEAQVYSCPNTADPLSCAEFFFIDEETIQKAITTGTNIFAVQVHNFALGMDDMTSLPLLIFGVQGADTTFLSFPNDANLHTNFNLSSTGQRISLKDPNDKVVDEYIVEEMHVNHSRGRYPDGSPDWCLMEVPSPCAQNTGNCKDGYGDRPTFSLLAGFYNSSQQVSITTKPSGETVYYTTDGNTPDQSSNLYTTPITINQTTVLRARQFPSDIDLLPGRVATSTYIINDKPSLPVICLTTDSVNLFDTLTGIYMLGPNVDTLIDEFPYWGSANYFQDWDRPAYVEYFDQNGAQDLGQDCSIKIHGNFSRGWPQKSFRFFANDKYGGNWFNFSPFPGKPGVTRFKSFNVRNGGVDYNTMHFREGLMERAARNTHLDIMDHQPCVMYLNGKYWGVYGIRERQDEKYIQENYGIDGDYIDLLRFNGDVMNGSEKAFLDMVDFIVDNDMGLKANYDTVKNILDIENFCDYIITETYIVNGDWISEGGQTNNIKFWRNTRPVSKWRYILWDTDLGLNLVPPWKPGDDYRYDYLGAILQPEYNDPHSLMLQNLLDNQDFKNYFINRFADLVNTTFNPKVFGGLAQEIFDEYNPEMHRHFALWGAPPKLIWGIFTLGRASNVAEWTSEFDTVMTFINERPRYARDNMEALFSLNKQVDVTLDVVPAAAGKIKISTIIPESYPWSGVYYDGVPVTMKVIPNPGYKFKYWQSDVLITSPDTNTSLTLNISANDTFKVYFEVIDYNVTVFPNPFSDEITIRYQLLEETQVSIELFDLMSKEMIILSDYANFKTEGEHTLIFDPSQYNLASGIYFLSFKTPAFQKIIKIIRVRTE